MAQTLTSAIGEMSGSYLVLNDISWDTYQKLLDAFAEHPKLRMT